ncbi:hypothetical protein D3C71_2014180 [compost metagenome]
MSVNTVIWALAGSLGENTTISLAGIALISLAIDRLSACSVRFTGLPSFTW